MRAPLNLELTATAWTCDRSTLDRYCPTFEAEYPPGVGYATTELRKAARGIRLDGATLPRRMRQTSSHRHLPDLLLLDSQWVVSSAFRQLIEEREPGIHQFFPIEVLDNHGAPTDRRYFIFVICRQIDAVVLEPPQVKWFTRPDGTTVPVTGEGPLVVDRKAIAGCHIWRNAPYFSHYRFISNDLRNAIESTRLEKLLYTKIKLSER